MGTLTTRKLGATVGAEVLGVDPAQLLSDDTLPKACMEALEENGVLVFRALHIDDDTQVAFSKRLDDVGKAEPAAAAADLQRDARSDQELHRRLPAGDGLLAHRRRAGRRPQQGDHAQRARDLRHGGRDRVRQHVRRLRRPHRRREGAVRGPPCAALARGFAAPHLPRPHARAAGGLAFEARQGAPARLAAPVGPALAGDRRLGVPRCRHGPRRGQGAARRPARTVDGPRACLPARVDGRATWSFGTTPASCTGCTPTTPRRDARCTAPP